jgi:hypothetical protein
MGDERMTETTKTAPGPGAPKVVAARKAGELERVPMARNLQPRPAVVIRPAFVSQETCLQVLGVDARRYLELVLPACAGQVTRLGKLRLVPLDAAEVALRALAAAGDDVDGAAVDAAEHEEAVRQPQTVDEVLAAVGRRRIA